MTMRTLHTAPPTPFEDLVPLHAFLGSVKAVTDHPSYETIAAVERFDAVVTERAVLYPKFDYVPPALRGYEPITVSDVVVTLAQLALTQPGDPDYWERFREVTDRETGATHTVDRATPLSRYSHATGALVDLGYKLPLSGAFKPEHIALAMAAIVDTLYDLGDASGNSQLLPFRLGRLAAHLTEERSKLRAGEQGVSPLSRRQALRNVRTALDVVQRARRGIPTE